MSTGASSDSVSRIREVFVRARGIADGSEREAFLAEACRGHPDLKARIGQMLAREGTSSTFLEEGPIPSSALGSPEEVIGKIIGRYRVVEKLGEGGFGEVFRVEQTEPVHREWALKVIKPGMDSREVIARFEREQQALALMDHPNIALVHDAGTTDSGRPYFVMELARGKRVTTYCDQNQMPVSARLQLFRQICAAVQHAHQKGIIHRDLKPSNIVVMTDPDSGDPVPKIIDFGIAKSLQGPLTNRTLVTQRDVFLGTPAYMSPEQLALSGEDLDTRTDIYALGVLLYELLSGVPPFERETLDKEAFSEVERIIREVEPLRPSDRVRALGPNAEVVAQTRMTAGSTLERTLRGDLDWIVIKAIEKDRDRRYQSAGELSDDIDRYLESVPVEASPPGTFYRVGKFIRRHRTGVGFACAMVLAIVAGLILATIGFSRASQQRDRAQLAELVAEVESARVKAVQSLYEPYRWQSPNRQSDFFYLSSGDDLVPSSKVLRESLDSIAGRLETDLPGLAAVESDLRRKLADSYLSLELTNEALVQLDRLVVLSRETYGDSDVRYADSLMDKAAGLNRGFRGTADNMDEGVGISRGFRGDIEFSQGYSHQRVTPVWQREEAVHLAREAVAIYRRHDHVSPLVIDAVELAGGGDNETWEPRCREIVDLTGRFYGEDSIMTLASLQQLGICLAWKGRFEEAEPLIRQYQEALRRQDDGPYTVMDSDAVAIALHYFRNHQHAEAERIYREEIDRLEGKVRGEFLVSYGQSLRELDSLLEAQGRPDPEIKAKMARIALWGELDPALPRVDYSVRIPEPGRYRFYLRWDGFDPMSDSVAVRIRELQDGVGGGIADVYGFSTPGFPGDADFATVNPWQCRANFESAGSPETGTHTADWTVEEPGDYTIQLIGSKTGVAVDAFVFQRADLPAPTGFGPSRTRLRIAGDVAVMTDGWVAIEAEDPSERIPGRITDWVAVPSQAEAVVTFTNFTGDSYLQVLPESDGFNPVELIRNRARAAEMEGDYARALLLHDEAIQLDPSAESYYRRGVANERFGDHGCALEDFLKAIELNPNDWSPYPHLWDAHLRIGNNDIVIDLVSPYIEIEGGMEFLKYKLARARANKGLWREAIEGIKPQESGAGLWVLRGDLYADHQEYERAWQEYQMAARMDQSSLVPYAKLTSLYLINRDRAAFEGSLAEMPMPDISDPSSKVQYLWLSTLGPDTCTDRSTLGEVLAGVVDPSGPLNPEEQMIRAELGGAALVRLGQFELAADLLTEAQDLEAEPWGCYRSRSMFFLAMALHGQGRVDDARNWYARAEACLEEERVSIPAGDDPAYPMAWEKPITVELLREEAAAILGVGTDMNHAVMPN